MAKIDWEDLESNYLGEFIPWGRKPRQLGPIELYSNFQEITSRFQDLSSKFHQMEIELNEIKMGLKTPFRCVSDNIAMKEVTEFIKERKEEGFKKISIVELVKELKLPAEQIEEIMKTFEKEKRVKRYG